MQKRLVQVSSFSILAGLITAAVQTCLLYFLDSGILILLVILVLDLVMGQYLLENSFTYELCFRYLLVTELLTLTLAVPAWFGFYGKIFPYSDVMLWLYLLHLAVVFLFCTIRYLADFGPRFMNYNLFFIEFSILLWLTVTAGFLYCHVYRQTSLTASGTINLIPFYHLAGIIESWIKEGAPIRPYLLYMLSYGAFFIPSGFYLHLLTRKHIVLRLLVFLLLPAMIEVLQYFFAPAMCEIDDIFPAFLGCLIGSAVFALLNHICYSLHEEDFLEKRNRTSLYH